MKVAAITDDGTTISQHFGRARYYKVLTIEDGTITGEEMREKAGHHSPGRPAEDSDDHGSRDWHATIASPITDCEALIVRGMGRRAYDHLQEAGLQAYVTQIADIGEAVQAYVAGDLKNYTDLLH